LADSAADIEAAQYSSNGDTPFGEVASLLAATKSNKNDPDPSLALWRIRGIKRPVVGK